VKKPFGKGLFIKTKKRQGIKMDVREIGCENGTGTGSQSCLVVR
jgi:hypothetical protein